MVLLLLATLLPIAVMGSGHIALRLNEYHNIARGKLLSGSCCDGILGSDCTSITCDPYFIIRITEQNQQTQYVDLTFQTDSLKDVENAIFTDHIGSSLSTVNGSISLWPGAVEIYVDIMDNNSDIGIPDDLISQLSVTYTTGQPLFNRDVFFPITFQPDNSILKAEVNIRCDTDYTYDIYCQTFCHVMDNATGHVGCDSKGKPICLPGWVGNPRTGCHQARCDANTCQNGGTCRELRGSDGYLSVTCSCARPFSGRYCENSPTTTPVSTVGSSGVNPTVGTANGGIRITSPVSHSGGTTSTSNGGNGNGSGGSVSGNSSMSGGNGSTVSGSGGNGGGGNGNNGNGNGGNGSNGSGTTNGNAGNGGNRGGTTGSGGNGSGGSGTSGSGTGSGGNGSGGSGTSGSGTGSGGNGSGGSGTGSGGNGSGGSGTSGSGTGSGGNGSGGSGTSGSGTGSGGNGSGGSGTSGSGTTGSGGNGSGGSGTSGSGTGSGGNGSGGSGTSGSGTGSGGNGSGGSGTSGSRTGSGGNKSGGSGNSGSGTGSGGNANGNGVGGAGGQTGNGQSNNTGGNGEGNPGTHGDDSGGSNGGAIAGGVVGGLAALSLLSLLIFFLIRRKKRAQQVDAEEDGAEGKTGDTDGETKPEKAQETEEVGLKNKESSSLGLTESHNMPEIA